MFEQFSSGYYLGRLYVEPHDGDTPAMCRAQHEQVNEQLYASGEGVERTDLPLVMKLTNNHMAVRGAEDVPQDTLAVPRELIEGTRIRNPPTLHEVFLAKADRARQLLTVADGGLTADPATGAGDSLDDSDPGALGSGGQTGF